MAIGNTTGDAPIFETLIRSPHSAQGPTPHPPPIIEPPDPVPVLPAEPPPCATHRPRDPSVVGWASGIAWRSSPIGCRIVGCRWG
jgi:hypothetical protein